LESRPVRIDRLECRRYEFPWLEVEVACGKGTYIRALARDVGQALDCGACVQRLIRTAVGPFRLAETLPWDADAETARKHVRPLLAAVEHLPRLTLSAEMLWRLRHGQKPVSPPDLAGWVAVLDDDGQLSVLAEARVAERQLVPRMVFQSDS
ncbi:MAG TPA: tRNA pseudouridine(55) synthase TruB, partial [Gemmatales bacterium]|nr:tRNA pseudouridine(55) synthase TruB [Gemmatales bacterium]